MTSNKKATKITELKDVRKSQIKIFQERQLTVMDLFCGAGGFSEGFRSAGFRIVSGIDHWRPAVDTFNCNHGTNDQPIDVLSYEGNEHLIEALPDTDVILGSPPCVSFSYSNKLGNADKTEGLRLIKIFLSIVVIKKFKRKSKLIAWCMENVPNTLDSLQSAYSFSDLGLSNWAKTRGFSPARTAIDISGNAAILNAADFGVSQTRRRLFVGEVTKNKLSRPGRQSKPARSSKKWQALTTSKEIRGALPAPNCRPSSRSIRDPNYRSIYLPLRHLTDHFYETGEYELHWRDSELLKVSHPYMGKMAFPEKEEKPSRTIVANPFPRSREALLYKSEWGRTGDGEYRSPTVREAASLMSFPITYQFVGNERAKWKLVGNAVCPLLARVLATRLLRVLGVNPRRIPRRRLPESFDKVPNLNTFSPKDYDKPPQRRKLARFRGHPFKEASMTVALTNYDVPTRGALSDGTWRCFVTYGIGEGYKVQRVDLKRMEDIKRAVELSSPGGIEFVEHVTNGFSAKIPSGNVLQELFEKNLDEKDKKFGPRRLLEETKKIVFRFVNQDQKEILDSGIFIRDSIPVAQLYALFAVCHIVARTQE